MQKKFNILVADDEKGICNLVKNILSSEGYKVSTASTGKEAVNICRKKKTHLVLLDMAIPDTNGESILKKIKEMDQNIIVIILTGYGEANVMIKLMKTGAYGYIEKPFDIAYVKHIVKEALMSRRRL